MAINQVNVSDITGMFKPIQETINKHNEDLDKIAKEKGAEVSTKNRIKSWFGSDIDLKELYKNTLTDSLINAFSKIDAIDFKYTPEAQEVLSDNPSMDNNEHIGVIAQQLETNPATEGCVKENEDGIKMVDSNHLTAANTATLAEVCKKMQDLEERIKFLEGK